ncbi:MAG: hypothetical protein NC394_05060 [Bacteroides sp.]|nr:hypothetical protein [Bacteroides sp.]
MAKGITFGAQRLMENFLGSVEGRAALYDEEMNLLWTNFHEFFDGFDLKESNEETPIKNESVFTVSIDGVKEVLTVTPVYKSLRTISAYICIIRNSYEVYKMMSNTDISDFTDNMMKKNAEKLERAAELNADIGEAVRGGEDPETIGDIVAEQKRLLVSMRNETMYCIDTCYNKIDRGEVNCNLSMMFSALCRDAEESFKDLGRKVNFESESRDYYILENSKPLVTAFLHLLRAHLLLSPLKTPVNIATYYEPNGYNNGNFCIMAKTKLTPADKTEESVITTSRAYRELAKKVILFDYNGSFEYNDDDKTMQTIFKFPVLKKNRGPVLTTGNSWYLDEKKRILHAYMMDIIEQEIDSLEHAKMESAKKKKLAKHE